MSKDFRTLLAVGDNIKTAYKVYDFMDATHRGERWDWNVSLIDNLNAKRDGMEAGLDVVERIAPGLKDLIKGGTLMIDGIKLPSA